MWGNLSSLKNIIPSPYIKNTDTESMYAHMYRHSYRGEQKSRICWKDYCWNKHVKQHPIVYKIWNSKPSIVTLQNKREKVEWKHLLKGQRIQLLSCREHCWWIQDKGMLDWLWLSPSFFPRLPLSSPPPPLRIASSRVAPAPKASRLLKLRPLFQPYSMLTHSFHLPAVHGPYAVHQCGWSWLHMGGTPRDEENLH